MKNAIAYLTRSDATSVRQMLHGIHLLAKNFLPWSPADIVIFHEADFDRSLVEKSPVCSALADSGIKIRFGLVDFSAEHLGMEGLTPGQKGYRHMCHFFANDIFMREELRGYDFYMRLDVDSYVLSKVRYNVFERMRREGRKYAYRMVMNERAKVVRGLLAAATAHFTANPAPGVQAPAVRKVRLYYTNFEICDLEWFRSDGWQRYFAAIDATGGIWRHRWGDAPIRWLGLQYLLRPDQTLCLRWMAYFHQFLLRRGLTFRLPLAYLGYAASITIYGLRQKLRRKP